MPIGDPIPPERLVYRALRPKHLSEDKAVIKETAFLLTEAHGEYPAETELSFGVDANAASAGLQNIKYYTEISVASIRALGLRVTEDDDPAHICVSGMPLARENPELAHSIAKDLRNLASPPTQY
jgi:hypothetical protein